MYFPADLDFAVLSM